MNIPRTTLAALSATLILGAATAATSTHQSAPVPKAATTCTQIRQYGVTFTLDRAYACGQFANGDYWVAPDSPSGTVIITAMTPKFTGTTNGWQVNPTDVATQGFDGRTNLDLPGVHFDASLVPALPYTARAGQSIVKAVSTTDNTRLPLQTAAVLTVLASIPVNNGATLLRPPYFGLDKPLRSINDIHLEKLPQLAPPPNDVPTLASLHSRFQRVQLDTQTDWDGEDIHPIDNLPVYGAEVAIENTVAVLRLMLNDSAQDKLPLAIDLVEYGQDLSAALRAGLNFEALGGHRHGRKLVLSLTAALLEDAGIASQVHDAPYNTFQEDGHVHESKVTKGLVLWGAPATSSAGCEEADYWYDQDTGSGSRDCADPYDYIDGGYIPGDDYQLCCEFMAFRAMGVALRLMPELQQTWNNNNFLTYVDRMVNCGAHTLPDPYAPHGDGQPGNGRYPELNGSNKNGGAEAREWYDDPFADAMWTTYGVNPVPPICP